METERSDPKQKANSIREGQSRQDSDRLEMAEQESLHQAAGQLLKALKEQGLHISTAESCTGGMVASALVDLSGASDVFEEGYVTYSNRVKQKLLGVQQETLDRYTAVSSQTAAEMAEGVHARTEADLTVSVTGYAGPEDGEDGTPAGTVYVGTWYLGEIQIRHYRFHGDRNSCRRQAAQAAIMFALERMEQSG